MWSGEQETLDGNHIVPTLKRMSLLVEVGNGALGIWIPREEKTLEAEFDLVVKATKNYPRGSLGWGREKWGEVEEAQAEEVGLGLLEGLLRRQESE